MKQYFLTGLILLLIALVQEVSAQVLLKKVVHISANNTPLADVLKNIGRQGGFSFSYSNIAVAGKRPITLKAS